MYDELYLNFYKFKYKILKKSNRMNYAWNPVYNLLMAIKDNYNRKFKDENIDFKSWLEKLNKKRYNKIFDHLQVSQENNLVLIRYGIADMQPSMWTNKRSIFRECRSIVIDIKNENIVISPFKKFFNLNEIKETKIDILEKKIKNAKIFEIADKLDGSMQCVRYYNDSILLSGSRSINRDQSWRVNDGYSMLNDNYKKMTKDNANLTFIFEYISLKDAHVVNYKKNQEGLYLIGIRDVYTGRQFSYQEVLTIANEYNIKVVTKEMKTLEQLLNEMTSFKAHEKEGWVLNVDGYYVKLKCDDYVHLHRILDKCGSANVIIKSIADGTYDDLISKIPDAHRIGIERISSAIFDYISIAEKEINNVYQLAPKDSQKEFMIYVDNNCKKELRPYVKFKYFNTSYHVLKRRNGSYKKLTDLGLSYESFDYEPFDIEGDDEI